MNQIDEIFGSFLDPPSPSRGSSGDGSSNVLQKEDVSSLGLEAYEWKKEDRENMMHICDQVWFYLVSEDMHEGEIDGVQ